MALQVFELEHNKISDEGAQALAEALKVNSALRWLSVYFNNIPDAVKQQIRSDRLEFTKPTFSLRKFWSDRIFFF